MVGIALVLVARIRKLLVVVVGSLGLVVGSTSLLVERHIPLVVVGNLARLAVALGRHDPILVVEDRTVLEAYADHMVLVGHAARRSLAAAVA